VIKTIFIVYYFTALIRKKTAAEAHRFVSEIYSKSAPSIKTCEYWFRLFKTGNFDLKDKERLGQPKKFEDAELQELLNENLARMLEDLAQILNVGKSTVSDRLHAKMGKIKKEGKYCFI